MWSKNECSLNILVMFLTYREIFIKDIFNLTYKCIYVHMSKIMSIEC